MCRGGNEFNEGDSLRSPSSRKTFQSLFALFIRVILDPSKNSKQDKQEEKKGSWKRKKAGYLSKAVKNGSGCSDKKIYVKEK